MLFSKFPFKQSTKCLRSVGPRLSGFQPQLCAVLYSSGIGRRRGIMLSVSPDGGSYKISALSILSSSGFVIAASCKDITVLMEWARQRSQSDPQTGTEPILRHTTAFTTGFTACLLTLDGSRSSQIERSQIWSINAFIVGFFFLSRSLLSLRSLCCTLRWDVLWHITVTS